MPELNEYEAVKKRLQQITTEYYFHLINQLGYLMFEMDDDTFELYSKQTNQTHSVSTTKSLITIFSILQNEKRAKEREALFKNSKDANYKMLRILMDSCSPDADEIWEKLKIVHQLQKTLLLSTDPIEQYKVILKNNKNPLEKNRNPKIDTFLDVVSFILLPIAMGRSLYNRAAYGRWNFMWSEGKAMIEQADNELEKIVDCRV